MVLSNRQMIELVVKFRKDMKDFVFNGVALTDEQIARFVERYQVELHKEVEEIKETIFQFFEDPEEFHQRVEFDYCMLEYCRREEKSNHTSSLKELKAKIIEEIEELEEQEISLKFEVQEISSSPKKRKMLFRDAEDNVTMQAIFEIIFQENQKKILSKQVEEDDIMTDSKEAEERIEVLDPERV